MDTHVGCGPGYFSCSIASGCGHIGLAAAIVEETHICIPEMTVGEAVHHIVDAGLAQTKPRGVVEDPRVGNDLGGAVGEDHPKWQPEDDEDEKAVEVSACQGKIPRVSQRWLKIWRSHESTDVENDPDMSVKGQNDGQDNEQGHNGHLIGHNSGRFARAVVKAEAKNKLQPRRCSANKPNEQEDHCCRGLVEPGLVAILLGRTQT